jgi:hypothetical protein
MDVKEYVGEWEFVDDEKDQSHIKVTLANPEMKLSGKFKYGQPLEIRFGYQNELSDPAHLPIGEIKESYVTGKPLTIVVTGVDESSKLSGGNNKGNQGKMDDAKRLRQSLSSRNLKMEGNTKGENSGCKGSCYNESDRALAYRIGNSLAAENGWEGGDQEQPENPLSNEQGASSSGSDMQKDKGHTFSSASRWAGDGKGGKRDENRSGNHGGQQNQDPVTAKLELKGYPLLKAKGTVTILGVGEAASGDYYVKKVTHKWKPGDGYKTEAELSRGGTGGKGVGGTPPIVMYADIWKKGTMYVGPRKTTDPAQTVFTFGEGKHLIGFEMTVKPQKNRGGGEPKKGGKGEGIDLRKKLASYTEGVQGSGATSGESGGSQ